MGALECFVEDIFKVRLAAHPALLMGSKFEKVKLPVAMFLASDSDRITAIATEFTRQTNADLGKGVGRFERLLEPVGLDGQVARRVKDAMYEGQQIQRGHRGPRRTTGSSQPAPAARTTSVSGAAACASCCGPSASRAATATAAYTIKVIARAVGIARGMVRCGARTSSPSVAIRAYPAKAKNNSPAPATPGHGDVGAELEPGGVSGAGAEPGHHDRGKNRRFDRDNATRQPRRFLHPRVVDRSERHHRRDRDRVRVLRPDVEPDHERHRRTRGGLADHERPPGQITEEFAETFTPVDVGATRGRIPCGQPGRGDPAGKDLDAVHPIRDEVRTRIQALITELTS